MELGEFDIQYVLRIAIKAQIPADFILELVPSPEAEGEHAILTWTLFVDGSTTSERDIF